MYKNKNLSQDTNVRVGVSQILRRKMQFLKKCIASRIIDHLINGGVS